MRSCKCEVPPFNYAGFETLHSGEDRLGAEVTVQKCNYCGQAWLKYSIEEPHYLRSGRWWRVVLVDDKINVNQAREYVESQAWCFVGGSFYSSTGKRIVAPLKVA